MEQLLSFIKDYINDPVVGKAVLVFLLLVIVFVIKKALNRIIQKRFSDSTTRYRANKAIGFVLFLLIILACSLIFSDKLQGLTVAFGVAGAGIAFALQEVITSVAGWVAINLGGFFKIGDRVQLGGIKGDVIDIGVLRSTIMEIGGWVEGDLYNGRVVRVANSFVFKEPVYNYSGDFPFLWDELTFIVTYDSDLDLALEFTDKIAKDYLAEFEKSAKSEWTRLVKKFAIENARIDNFTSVNCSSSGVHITLRYVTHYRSRRMTKSHLFQKIIKKVNQAPNVSFTYSTLEITNLSDINKSKQ